MTYQNICLVKSVINACVSVDAVVGYFKARALK
jgi:hypothetical protein